MTAAPNVPSLLAVDNLAISYASGESRQQVVHDVSFEVRPGEFVALVGESGSGKTTIAQSVIGLLPRNGRIEAGAIRLNGITISDWNDTRLNSLRGARISLVPQDPGQSLNPTRTIGAQIGEIFRIHGQRDRAEIRRRVIELITRVGLSDPELRAGQYPHELSGGMRQRVLIAIAIALKPELIIADEPTSALDVTVQRRILDLIDDLRREIGTAVLLITHDLGIAADRADRIVVLRHGRIQEQGETRQLIAAPQNVYTRQLLADVPVLAEAVLRPAPSAAAADAVLVRNLTVEFGTAWSRTRFRAVDDVSFRVAKGTTHAIVGESGSGKTTTVRAIVGYQRPTSGQVIVAGTELSSLRGERLRQFRRSIQLVYQNPFGSLDPRQDIRDIIAEPLLNYAPVLRLERQRKVEAMLDRVKLPRAVLDRRPAALSGGQRQRVAIARALILDPPILVLDEAVSALDVTVQAQILKLLDELQRELSLTYLFVSHDLAVVRQIADTVSVFKNGRIVESGAVESVFHHPRDPYTIDLIAAVPGRNLPRRVAIAAE
ncbi:ABC transporter ATP-binding protein [Bradyrhizobium sp. BTAi1]|uniref:dipeptide ABC transporter ATP-binding protein n=1 Tax=Bradyrhizobium sp. (strain BTAi1 / ATCC BAA-1182) TaxID=288000 RepID=UPI00005DCB36|nr:ABC transporter ATP-binding protein [Bradyrhizobium sp. BTAi1]ABQ36874.1 putative ABC transporter (ATP-binding protein) [Bradyrhizobium sp. BTAi1]